VRDARKGVDPRRPLGGSRQNRFREFLGVGKFRISFMPRRSIWKGTFFDAFLLRMKKNRESLFNRKIWSRRSSILPEFVDCSVLLYNGKTPVRCKITEGKVGHKFGEFASTRRRRPSRTKKGKGGKGKK